MRLLITGICGFVGSQLARSLAQESELELVGIDNLSRPGSWANRDALRADGLDVRHGDVRLPSDLEAVGSVDWIVDAAANPSVLAGTNANRDFRTESTGASPSSGDTPRQLVENNLIGTLNLLEHCRHNQAGLTLLSTSRVYSMAVLSALPLADSKEQWQPNFAAELPAGLTEHGISEAFATSAPVSLYGASKLASEQIALEYSHAFGLPVHINRCGVLAGAGQFGRPDQGIFAYWLHSWRERASLRYIGFDGLGKQTRDCLHPSDLANLINAQLSQSATESFVVNVGGGMASARSLNQLSAWCQARWGEHTVATDPSPRVNDLPWIVLDSRLAQQRWQWQPTRTLESILSEIADHADAHPSWLAFSR